MENNETQNDETMQNDEQAGCGGAPGGDNADLIAAIERDAGDEGELVGEDSPENDAGVEDMGEEQVSDEPTADPATETPGDDAGGCGAGCGN